MDEKLPLDKYYKLWLLLSQTRAALFRSRQKLAGQYLHPNQANALITIWALEGKATPTMLSHVLFLELHSISELISRMETKGLVKKTKEKNHVRIAITEKGRVMGHKVIQIDFVRKIMSNLSDEELKQLEASLSKLFQSALDELKIEDRGPLI
jgi:DNA-binding MarR family transcriptional regulator